MQVRQIPICVSDGLPMETTGQDIARVVCDLVEQAQRLAQEWRPACRIISVSHDVARKYDGWHVSVLALVERPVE